MNQYWFSHWNQVLKNQTYVTYLQSRSNKFFDQDNDLKDFDKMLNTMQEDAAYAGTSGGRNSSVGSKPVVYHLRDTLTTEELLEKLAYAAADTGNSVSLEYSFIATGETGPCVYLCDPDLNPVKQLGLDYQWDLALYDALEDLSNS